MSGVEILGVASAVLQIADLGGRVSVRLFGFARKVKGAALKIDVISKEIAATGALLQQLGQQLEKDSQAQLLRPELIQSANVLVCECKKIFQNIDSAIDGDLGNKIILNLKQKLHYAYLESEIETLRTNLENLKSSISIMQNMLIYAEQLRNREERSVYRGQRHLLEVLGEEKLANEERYRTLMEAIEARSGRQARTNPSPEPPAVQPSRLLAQSETGPRQFAVENSQTNSRSLSPAHPNSRIVLDDCKLQDYNSLLARMLAEIHSNHYNLEKKMRSRLHDGVLDIHWREWAPFRQVHKDDFFLKQFAQLPELHRFWLRKIEEHKETFRQRKQHKFQSDGKFTLQGLSLRADDEAAQTPKSKLQYIVKKARVMLGPEIGKIGWTQPRRKSAIEAGQRLYEAEENLHEADRQQLRLTSETEKIVKQSSVRTYGRDPPTYTKVKKSRVSADTLNFHDLPWTVDTTDPECFLIKKHVNRDFMETLCRDTQERQAQRARQNSLRILHARSARPKRPISSGFGTVGGSGGYFPTRKRRHSVSPRKDVRYSASSVQGISQMDTAAPPSPPELDVSDRHRSLSRPHSDQEARDGESAASTTSAIGLTRVHMGKHSPQPEPKTRGKRRRSEVSLSPSESPDLEDATYLADLQREGILKRRYLQPPPASFDIPSLLSQWTTLEPHEIALGS